MRVIDAEGGRRDIIALSTRPSLALYKEGYSRWLEISQRMLEQTGAMMTFGLQPVTKRTMIETGKRGGNPMDITTESQLCTHFFFSVKTCSWQQDRTRP